MNSLASEAAEGVAPTVTITFTGPEDAPPGAGGVTAVICVGELTKKVPATVGGEDGAAVSGAVPKETMAPARLKPEPVMTTRSPPRFDPNVGERAVTPRYVN